MLPNFLTPGYVRWDGTKFITDPNVKVVGSVGGDLSGNYPTPIVVGIQGYPISQTVPVDGNLLSWVAADGRWEPKILSDNEMSGITWSGDLSGTGVSPNVINIHGASVPASGALTTGNVLQVTGTSALSYAAINLAGGSNFVTGVLPIGNQASQTMAGDVTGTTAVNKVVTLTGAAGLINVPTAAIEMGLHSAVAQSGLIRFGNVFNTNAQLISARDTTNNIDVNLISSTNAGLGALVTFGGVGVAYAQVTGEVYGAALIYGGSGSSLSQTSSNTIQSSINTGFNVVSRTGLFTFDSDANLTGWQFNINTVQQLNISTTSITTIPATFGFAAATTTPIIRQVATSGTSITGQSLTILAQNVSGTTTTGGDLILSSGSGSSAAGTLHLQAGAVDTATITVNQFSTKKGIAKALRRVLTGTGGALQILVTDDIMGVATGLSAILPPASSTPVAGQTHTVFCMNASANPTFSVTSSTSNIMYNGAAVSSTCTPMNAGTGCLAATFVWDAVDAVWYGAPGF